MLRIELVKPQRSAPGERPYILFERKPITMLSFSFRRKTHLAGLTTAIVLAATAALSQNANTPARGRSVTQVRTEKLPDIKNKVLTAVIVNYPPGGASKAHHHDADVFAYVLSGEIRSQVEGEDVKIYQAGESVFEPPGEHHVISENASKTEPASMLVVFVANDGAELTTFDK
ncbi:cupin domain-containing protein [Bradyrhizobium sp. STM 3562]|uniref:cupin domain-containing protein n=1 Tax=Bradyrhizobium sp. STM 3562 TaxID=578924 RepID=UPI00388D47C4